MTMFSLLKYKVSWLVLLVLFTFGCATNRLQDRKIADLADRVQDIEFGALMGLAESADANFFPVSGSLTGGGTGSLDKITSTADNDAAIAMFNAHGTYGDAFMAFTLDDNAGSGDDEPWYVNSGDGGNERWELLDGRFSFMYSKIKNNESDAATITVNDYDTGTVYVNTDGVQEADLPADPTGLVYCFCNDEDSTGAITLDPNVNDIIIIDGALESAGEAIVSSGSIADFLCIYGIDAVYWRVTGYTGTWDGAVD